MLRQPERGKKFDWGASVHILYIGFLVLFVGSLAGWLWTPFAAGFARAWITHPICCVLNSLQYAILAMLAWSTRSTPYWFRCGLFVAAESAKLTPGTNFEVMSFTDSAGKTRKIAVSICYESWQPWLPQYHSILRYDWVHSVFMKRWSEGEVV
jgi:hypothetical protein